MNREQKIASTTLIISLLGLTLLIIGVVIRRYLEEVSTVAIIVPGAVLTILILILVSRFKPDAGAVKVDERDREIQKNASLAGFGAVFLLVILVSYVPFAIAPEAKIPTAWFPGLLPVAALCYGFATSLSTLIQYGLEGRDGEGGAA